MRLGFESFVVGLDLAENCCYVENRNYVDHFVEGEEPNFGFENHFVKNLEADRFVEKLEVDYQKTKLDRFVSRFQLV